MTVEQRASLATTGPDREAVNSAGIVLDGVVKRFERPDGSTLEAVSRVDESVAEGTFISVVGPSGCGKSTLLSIIAGLQPATEGEVSVAGKPVRGPQRSIGFVFQEDSTLPWKSVEENVRFGMRIAGVPADQQRTRAQEMIDLVGLQGFEKAYPSELSGGMRQRVAIARTLALDPDALLMDEPFGALDQQTRLLIGAEVRRIWAETHKTVVFVTHDIQEAILLSQEVWVMSYRPGRIIDRVQIDLPQDRGAEMIGSPAFGELFNRIWTRVRGEAMQAFEEDEHRPVAGDGRG